MSQSVELMNLIGKLACSLCKYSGPDDSLLNATVVGECEHFAKGIFLSSFYVIYVFFKLNILTME